MLLNPPLRQAAKRYRSFYSDSANIKRQSKNGQQNNFGKAVWLSFAKAKEKQNQHTSQRNFASHLLLPNRTKTAEHKRLNITFEEWRIWIKY